MFLGVVVMRYFSAFRHLGEIRNKEVRRFKGKGEVKEMR